GLARGYLNRPELSNEKFLGVQNPFFKRGFGRRRQYKTGDLACWLSDGNIRFLGRIDNQVKIRGFRIEFGEIEHRILSHPGVESAVVLIMESELTAYIVSQQELSVSGLYDYLSDQLPGYMVPSHFIPLDAIPLTVNGKVDRKALPLPEIKAGGGYIAPSNEGEHKLTEIWSEILRIDKDSIGIDDSFFDLKGHSLRATIVVSRVHKVFDVKVPLKEMFKTP
ncbi:MAG: AMP-binding protein, partial [bacterium]|nr:AMP-binding protein [bacterium]